MSDYAVIAIPIFISISGLVLTCGMQCGRWYRHISEHKELEKRINILEQNQRAFVNQYAPPPSAPPYYPSKYPSMYPPVV